MRIPFKNIFNNAGEHCNLCYIDHLNNKGCDNKRYVSGNRESAKDILTNIVGCANNNGVVEIIGEALSRCKRCRFENPEIFKYLDEEVFNSS